MNNSSPHCRDFQLWQNLFWPSRLPVVALESRFIRSLLWAKEQIFSEQMSNVKFKRVCGAKSGSNPQLTKFSINNSYQQLKKTSKVFATGGWKRKTIFPHEQQHSRYELLKKKTVKNEKLLLSCSLLEACRASFELFERTLPGIWCYSGSAPRLRINVMQD